MNSYKKDLARLTNKKRISGGPSEALAGADAVVGVSGPNTIKAAHVSLMSERAIVFALANPVPEIMPDDARRGGAAVVATGRSDFPNQINNALVFSGVFRGALDNNVRIITDAMRIKATLNLAALVKRPTAGNIIPNPFDKRVAPAVAKAIR